MCAGDIITDHQAATTCRRLKIVFKKTTLTDQPTSIHENMNTNHDESRTRNSCKRLKIVLKKPDTCADDHESMTKKHSMRIIMKKKGLKMVSSPFYIPKNEEVKPLGEDAYFVAAEEQTIGVADGVSGWAKQGIDSGHYARKLMKNSADAVVALKGTDGNPIGDPERILQEAFSNTTGVQGASTACIVSHNDGVLRAANVGDSGFMVFRDGKMMYKSQTQQRRFNCPYQLGNHSSCDRPDSAIQMEVTVMVDDLVVLGTDGLLDNMHVEEIEKIIAMTMVAKAEREGKTVEEKLAREIAEAAYYKSLDKYGDCPFVRASLLEGKHHKGGKVDDITVVVGRIIQNYDLQIKINSDQKSTPE